MEQAPTPSFLADRPHPRAVDHRASDQTGALALRQHRAGAPRHRRRSGPHRYRTERTWRLLHGAARFREYARRDRDDPAQDRVSGICRRAVGSRAAVGSGQYGAAPSRRPARGRHERWSRLSRSRRPARRSRRAASRSPCSAAGRSDAPFCWRAAKPALAGRLSRTGWRPATRHYSDWPKAPASPIASRSMRSRPIRKPISPSTPVRSGCGRTTPCRLRRIGSTPSAHVTDVVTEPEISPLLAAARACGLTVQTGRAMAEAQRDIQVTFFGLDQAGGRTCGMTASKHTTMPPDSRAFVSSFARGLKVIESFGPDNRTMTVAEVAERTGVDRAVARRLLLTLRPSRLRPRS